MGNISINARRFFGGVPTILIQNGKIIGGNLSKARFNVNDLLEELRIKGVFDISNVELAILETNGKISIRLKSKITSSLGIYLLPPGCF